MEDRQLVEHLGYDKHAPEDRNGGDSRNGTRPRTVLTEVGPVPLQVPRDRDDTCADVKVVQARVRHASARTTLDVYGHLWPDSDETTRTAVERVLSRRLAESVRNDRGTSD